jgi:hypothetical protein
VQPLGPPPRGAGAEAEPIGAGEAGDVGLVDRDRRQAELAGGGQPTGADHERRGQVHQVRLEVGQRREHPSGRHADRQRGDEREVDGRQPHDRRVLVPVGAGPWTDDQALDPVPAQVRQYLDDGVGHPVDLRQEALGDDRDAHPPSVRAPPVHRVAGWRTLPEILRSGIPPDSAGPQT